MLELRLKHCGQNINKIFQECGITVIDAAELSPWAMDERMRRNHVSVRYSQWYENHIVFIDIFGNHYIISPVKQTTIYRLAEVMGNYGIELLGDLEYTHSNRPVETGDINLVI